ncbi:polypyrimidine tract-binding protein homolog 3 [Tanacetum coccineum]
MSRKSHLSEVISCSSTYLFQSRQNVIVARNSLQGCNIYEGCCQLDIQFLNLEELQENQEEHICYYNWENCFSILNAKEAGITKSPLSADTFGNSGVDESETSGPETPAKEVVDNGNGSALIFLVGYVLEHKSSEKGVDSGSRKRDYALFGASLFAFLNLGPGSFAHRRIWDPGINRVIIKNNTFEDKVVSKETRTSMKFPMLMMSSVVFDFKSALQHGSSL